jgi:hypothetical protein
MGATIYDVLNFTAKFYSTVYSNKLVGRPEALLRPTTMTLPGPGRRFASKTLPVRVRRSHLPSWMATISSKASER